MAITSRRFMLLVTMALGGLRRLGRFGFYGAFALAVTASVQLVGVYLVFSSLIVPALATRGWAGPRRYVIAYMLGVAGYVLGLVLSALFDLPSGAVIVWTLAGCGLLLAAVAKGGQESSTSGVGISDSHA